MVMNFTPSSFLQFPNGNECNSNYFDGAIVIVICMHLVEQAKYNQNIVNEETFAKRKCLRFSQFIKSMDGQYCSIDKLIHNIVSRADCTHW